MQTLTLTKPLNLSAFYIHTGKRLFDIAFSLTVLTLGLPLFFLIALLIFISSPGNVLYKHPRVGQKGALFGMLKFRTMYLGADQKLKALLDSCPEKKKEWELYFKLKEDPRVFPFGKFLRKTSLDEFPQFFNVLMGDLSLVGPRPMVPLQVAQYMKEKAPYILSAKPGLTCIWQVSGRNHISTTKQVQMDLWYVRNRSFKLDLFLILKTIQVMLFPKGAY